MPGIRIPRSSVAPELSFCILDISGTIGVVYKRSMCWQLPRRTVQSGGFLVKSRTAAKKIGQACR